MNESVSYWKNVFLVAAIFAVLTSIISIYSGYTLINSEFDGSGVPPGTLSSSLVCLLAALAGLVTIKLQSAVEIEMTLGRGALIGLISGILLAVFSSLFSQIWHALNPEFAEQMVEAMISNYENIPGFSAQMAEELGAETLESMTTTAGVLKAMAINIAFYGFLNALSGMAGAKFFCDDPNEL